MSTLLLDFSEKRLDHRTVLPYCSTHEYPQREPQRATAFYEDDDARGIRQDLVDRVRKILAVLIVAPDMSGVRGPPGWRIHQLSGDRMGTWSISVSGNWRITFEVEEDEIWHLNLEDYH